MQERLIINTEYFLQCHGHCSGCFLSVDERNSNNVFLTIIEEKIKALAQANPQKINHLIIGFGRGNILNLNRKSLEKLVTLIHWCEKNFNYQNITFEVSTSLIGKIQSQIEAALYLLTQSQNIYFNIVVNSEITSEQFWKNLDIFYQKTASYRQNEWKWTDNWGDILVLNVNPAKLPDIEFIEKFTEHYPSPVNISIFPFDKSAQISEDQMQTVIQWSENIWKKLSHKDLNIKNYLTSLNEISLSHNLQDYMNYQKQTEKSYYFIDKAGLVSQGTLSIMGEVDYIRLVDKFNLQTDFYEAYRIMQKNKACSMCDYQKECLMSGAYLNFLANSPNLANQNICASGYQKLFELSQT